MSFRTFWNLTLTYLSNPITHYCHQTPSIPQLSVRTHLRLSCSWNHMLILYCPTEVNFKQNSVRADCIFQRWPPPKHASHLYAPLSVWLTSIPLRCVFVFFTLEFGWKLVTTLVNRIQGKHKKLFDFRLGLTQTQLLFVSFLLDACLVQLLYCEEVQSTWRDHVGRF